MMTKYKSYSMSMGLSQFCQDWSLLEKAQYDTNSYLIMIAWVFVIITLSLQNVLGLASS